MNTMKDDVATDADQYKTELPKVLDPYWAWRLPRHR